MGTFVADIRQKPTPKEMRAQIEKIRRHHERAAKAYTRYSWRPGTATGQREHENWERHTEAFHAELDRLAEMIGAEQELQP